MPKKRLINDTSDSENEDLASKKRRLYEEIKRLNRKERRRSVPPPSSKHCLHIQGITVKPTYE